MSYNLSAIIGPADALQRASLPHVLLPQGMALHPTTRVTRTLSDHFPEGNAVGIVIDTFGGVDDDRFAYRCTNGKPQRYEVWERGVSPTNAALAAIGVVATDGHDEFDSIGLGRLRSTHEWCKACGIQPDES